MIDFLSALVTVLVRATVARAIGGAIAISVLLLLRWLS